LPPTAAHHINLRIGDSTNERSSHRYLRIISTATADLNVVGKPVPARELAILIFPPITALATYIWRNIIFSSGLGEVVVERCAPGTHALEKFGDFCIQVMTYRAPLDGLLIPSTFPYFVFFNVIFTPIYLCILVEANRVRGPPALSRSLLTGAILIMCTAGPIMPLYSLAFVLSGAASAQRRGGKSDFAVNRKNAEAIAFGIFVGYAIPSYVLYIAPSVLTFVTYIPYHLWMSLASAAWRAVRPDTPKTDTIIIKALYVILFAAAAIAHIGAIVYRWPDVQAALDFLLVPLSGLEPVQGVSPVWVLNLFQWDAWLSMTAMMIASLWSGKDAKERYRLVMWHVAATVIVGHGASLAGSLLWREMCLSAPEEKQEKTGKKNGFAIKN